MTSPAVTKAAPPVRLELAGITRRFEGVAALEGVDLAVGPGRIHAVIGENGAGKSTLAAIVAGVLRADRGSIAWDGRAVRIDRPGDARRLGIGTVFQHASLFEAMTVAENVALGLARPGRPGALADRIRRVSRDCGLPLDPGRRVATMSAGERQRVEIVRCLMRSARLLVLDEPTALLGTREAEDLGAGLRRLASGGLSILYVSHRLDEIRTLCDEATVLRAGRVVGRCDPRLETASSLADLMVGATGRAAARAAPVPPRPIRTAGPPALALAGLSIPPATPASVGLRSISLELRPGEIVGIAGVAGNGQDELMAALTGEVPASDASQVSIGGIAAGRTGPSGRRRLGLACLPEDRNGHAAVPAFTLAANMLLTAREAGGLSTLGVVRSRRAHDLAQAAIDASGLKGVHPRMQAAALSGGSLQRFLVGRALVTAPSVLVLAQPGWGVDVASVGAIRRALVERAAAGAAILLISQELEELLSLADRIAVLRAGRLGEALARASVDLGRLGLMMADGAAGRPA